MNIEPSAHELSAIGAICSAGLHHLCARIAYNCGTYTLNGVAYNCGTYT